MRARTVAVLLVALALSGACGGGNGSKSSPGDNPAITQRPGSTQAPGAAMVEPADPSPAARTIEIHAVDPFKFDPDKVDVHRGETVTFKVVNTGAVTHEFTVGDEEHQTEHEEEMKAMPANMAMPDEPTALTLKAGETKQLTLTFPKEGKVLYACHEAGHYAGGMKGTIAVS
jgi:uncharacterized cupredoxin-like copper-binding protein